MERFYYDSLRLNNNKTWQKFSGLEKVDIWNKKWILFFSNDRKFYEQFYSTNEEIIFQKVPLKLFQIFPIVHTSISRTRP